MRELVLFLEFVRRFESTEKWQGEKESKCLKLKCDIQLSASSIWAHCYLALAGWMLSHRFVPIHSMWFNYEKYVFTICLFFSNGIHSLEDVCFHWNADEKNCRAWIFYIITRIQMCWQNSKQHVLKNNSKM